jgi:hypothetical protein
MAHPDDRECVQGKTLFPVELETPPDGLPAVAEVRKTRFLYPYLVRWPRREGDPGEEATWAVATNLLVHMKPGIHPMKPGIHPEEAEAILRGLASDDQPGGATVRVEPLPLPNLYLVERHPPTDFNPEVLRFLLARRGEFLAHQAVATANPDYLYFSLPMMRAAPGSPTPADSEFERMGVVRAQAQGASGSREIRVAVLDTGVDARHEDLRSNLCTDQGKVVGYDFFRGRAEVVDGNGHGTYCAGLIGGLGYGVNQKVSIIPVRFMSASGCGTTALAIKAIGFALDRGARVISNSWGGVAVSPDLEAMIAEANRRKALFVAGAGNAPRDLDRVDYYPAKYEQPNMISVGGALDTDEPAPKWGRGKKRVHLAAPGESVPSTYNNPRHGEAWRSGTSVSTAFVSGACALVMAENPGMSHMDVRTRIIQSVKPMQTGTIEPSDACCAAGRLDVYSAVFGDRLNTSLSCPGK